MTIKILCVGKLKEAYWRDAVAEYAKRLSAFAKLTIEEVADEKTPDNASVAECEAIKIKEGKRLLAKISERDYVIALAIEGAQQSSEAFSAYLEKVMQKGASGIVFVIGGSLGLSPEILARADYKLSFSPMTFPHQLMRAVLMEQIYRAVKIMQGAPYHK